MSETTQAQMKRRSISGLISVEELDLGNIKLEAMWASRLLHDLRAAGPLGQTVTITLSTDVVEDDTPPEDLY